MIRAGLPTRPGFVTPHWTPGPHARHLLRKKPPQGGFSLFEAESSPAVFLLPISPTQARARAGLQCSHPETSLSQSPIVTATRVLNPIALDATHPAAEWGRAEPVRFCADWQGRNSDPGLDTEARVLWSPSALYLRFVCRYRDLFFFEDSDPDGRRDHLWDRDVAEAFLQPPDAASPRFYKEFEVAPNGMWIDLDISPR